MVTTSAIILRHRDVKEVDRISTLYTRDLGKIDVYTTGIRKIQSKFAGVFLPHAVLSVTLIRGRHFWRLAHAKQSRSFHTVLHDVEHYTLAAWACEALDALTKHDAPDHRLFELLCDVYAHVEQRSDHEHLLSQFLDQVFSCLGYRPSATSVNLLTLFSFFEHHVGYPLKSTPRSFRRDVTV